ncbi:fructosamine kinase family protein [Rhodococcus chondri]|uniref:Fructosamine kinase family protein n=1 Tax=Rhodococcus chondri TaxID=3065941 RepID=A0ABU7JMU3_9NOCA|nr:fructosamine kinase family protein [Rhodococcus sp. CC-R104]MEE2031194.1 fructosamine kinase family protein [Rhodococcus sp. CC-R104]
MSNRDVFRKQDPGAHPDFFRAEAAGLAWLADAGMPVPRVREVGAGHIVLDRITESPSGGDVAGRFGSCLARMHDAGAAGFGAAPDGYDGQLFIGRRPMSRTVHASWGEFYAVERVLPFVRIAVEAGSVTGRQLPDIERACDLIGGGALDDPEPPARLHGDLWNGNVLWSAHEVVLIDPAAHGGHRETDLAMLALFGCPHLDDILAGYEAAHPLRAGWRDRVPLHQLHPLAVHAAGYGAGYGRALHRAALATLELGGSR